MPVDATLMLYDAMNIVDIITRILHADIVHALVWATVARCLTDK